MAYGAGERCDALAPVAHTITIIGTQSGDAASQHSLFDCAGRTAANRPQQQPTAGLPCRPNCIASTKVDQGWGRRILNSPASELEDIPMRYNEDDRVAKKAQMRQFTSMLDASLANSAAPQRPCDANRRSSELSTSRDAPRPISMIAAPGDLPELSATAPDCLGTS